MTLGQIEKLQLLGRPEAQRFRSLPETDNRSFTGNIHLQLLIFTLELEELDLQLLDVATASCCSAD
jgi:hypothetical protein